MLYMYLQIKAYLACTLPSMAMTMIRFSPSVFASSTDAIVVKQKSNSQTKTTTTITAVYIEHTRAR